MSILPDLGIGVLYDGNIFTHSLEKLSCAAAGHSVLSIPKLTVQTGMTAPTFSAHHNSSASLVFFYTALGHMHSAPTLRKSSLSFAHSCSSACMNAAAHCSRQGV
ncbi:hypothetical protein M758_4G154900 [Ceratodon purpureus]|nr:hypothetical protein M758_4G154900 [Ceratodon purpureus]